MQALFFPPIHGFTSTVDAQDPGLSDTPLFPPDALVSVGTSLPNFPGSRRGASSGVGCICRPSRPLSSASRPFEPIPGAQLHPLSRTLPRSLALRCICRGGATAVSTSLGAFDEANRAHFVTMAMAMAPVSRASEGCEGAPEAMEGSCEDVHASKDLSTSYERPHEAHANEDGQEKVHVDHLAMAETAPLAQHERVSGECSDEEDAQGSRGASSREKAVENEAVVELDEREEHRSDQENRDPMQKSTPSAWISHEKARKQLWDASTRKSKQPLEVVPTLSSRNGGRKPRYSRGWIQEAHNSSLKMQTGATHVKLENDGKIVRDAETEEVAILRAENASLRALVEKVKDSELQLAEKEAQDAYARYVVQFEAMADALAEEESRRRTFEFDFARAEAEKHEAQGRVRKLLDERQKLEGKIKDTTQIAEQAEKERLEAERAKARVQEACRKLEGELEAMQAIQRENEKAQEAIHELEEELNAKQRVAKRLEDESEELAEELMQTKKSLQCMQEEKEGMKLHVQELEARQEELHKTVHQEEKKVRLAKEELEEANAAYQDQAKEIEKLKQSLASVECALEEANRTKTEAQDELERLEKKLELAVERADDAEEALKEMERAKQEREEEHEDLVQALYTSQQKVQELEEALENAHAECARMRVDLESLNEQLQGAKDHAQSFEKAQQDAEERCELVNSEIEKLHVTLKAAESRVDTLEAERQDARRHEERTRQEHSQLQETLAEALQRAEKAELVQVTAEEALKELQGEYALLEGRVHHTEAQYAEAQQELDASDEKSTAFQAQIKQLQEEVVQATRQCQEARALQKQANAAQHKAEQEADHLQDNLQQALGRAASAESALAELDRCTSEQTQSISKLQAAYSDALQRAENAERGLSNAKKNIEEHEKEMKHLIHEQKDSKAELRHLKMLVEKISTEKASLRGGMQSLECQVKELNKSLAKSEEQCEQFKKESISTRDELKSLKVEQEELQTRNERLKAALEDAMEELISVRMLWENGSDCEQPNDACFHSPEELLHNPLPPAEQWGEPNGAFPQETLPYGMSKQPTSQGVCRMLAMPEAVDKYSDPTKIYQNTSEGKPGPPSIQVPSQVCAELQEAEVLVEEHLPLSYPAEERFQGCTGSGEERSGSVLLKVDEGDGHSLKTPMLHAQVSSITGPSPTIRTETEHACGYSPTKERSLGYVENKTPATTDAGRLEGVLHEVHQNQDGKDNPMHNTVTILQDKACPSPIQIRTPVISHFSAMVDTATNTTPSLQLKIARGLRQSSSECQERETPKGSLPPVKSEQFSPEDPSEFTIRQRAGLSVNSSALSSSRFRLRMHMKLRRSAYTSGTFGTNATGGNLATTSRVTQYALASLESPP